jgi:hypothetical protein
MSVTKRQYLSEQIETGKYSPILLLNYFYNNRDVAKEVLTNDLASYTLTIDRTIVTLSIRRSDLLVSEIAMLSMAFTEMFAQHLPMKRIKRRVH